jgi:hypothetical protein
VKRHSTPPASLTRTDVRARTCCDGRSMFTFPPFLLCGHEIHRVRTPFRASHRPDSLTWLLAYVCYVSRGTCRVGGWGVRDESRGA